MEEGKLFWGRNIAIQSKVPVGGVGERMALVIYAGKGGVRGILKRRNQGAAGTKNRRSALNRRYVHKVYEGITGKKKTELARYEAPQGD